MRPIVTLSLAVLLAATFTSLSSDADLTTTLMRATYKIEGPAKQPGKSATGTVFILQSPISDSGLSYNVLVTAKHVLNDIEGASATLFLTFKQRDASYSKLPHVIQIRQGTTNLWTAHRLADVATMIISLPKPFTDSLDVRPGTPWLAGDNVVRTNNLHPGEELCCLGFPLGLESNPAGFPILRSGKIASFPVYPANQAPTILLDIRVFGGNSGGPVFFDLPGRHAFGKWGEAADWRGIAGLLSQDISHVQNIEGYFESSTRRDPLGLAIVVPAQFIQETIQEMLEKK